ncbi:hypothetical protein QA597_02470 [Marinilabiliaceae bacterium ANBcel2]|nr:hypothetical protein [Marinilabiliaceae bacterium ANBcel2]
MGRLILVVIVMIISGIIYSVKSAASKVTGSDAVKFQDESKKVMEKTARGVQWMNEQWEKAKANVSDSKQLEMGDNLKNLMPTEIIARVKNNPAKYDQMASEELYIEIAVYKMNQRQFDDAQRLIQEISEGEARDFMLSEIANKRKV